MARYLITGGAGFLGLHLSESLRAHGGAVRILDLAEAPEWARGVEYVRGDVRNAETVAAAMEGVDAVIHAAFASPRQDRGAIESVNVEGARQVAGQALKRGARLVLISSTIVEQSQIRNSAMELYRKSRAEAERVIQEHAAQGLSAAVVRPKTFLGPGRVSAFNIIFDWIRRGQAVLLMGRAQCRYQLLEIGDMAEGIRLLAGSAAAGVFFFGAREFGTLRDDLQALLDHAHTGSKLLFIPPAAARAMLRGIELARMTPPSELHYMSAWERDSVVDISRAAQELGWQPQKSNAEALCGAYDWYARSMQTQGAAASIHPLPGSHRALRKLIETVLR